MKAVLSGERRKPCADGLWCGEYECDVEYVEEDCVHQCISYNYLKVQVECDGEDVECQLLRPSTDVDRVFAGGSPGQWCSKQEVFRTPSSAAVEILEEAGYLSAHAIRPWTEELTRKG